MQKDIIEKEIAEIIKDFRQSSVGIEINQAMNILKSRGI